MSEGTVRRNHEAEQSDHPPSPTDEIIMLLWDWPSMEANNTNLFQTINTLQYLQRIA